MSHRDSVRVRKQRDVGDRRLFAVTFDDLTGNRWTYLVAAERNGQGWTAHGVAGGSDGPAPSTPRRPATEPMKLDVFGQWGSNVFYAEGKLKGTRDTAMSAARLTLANGAQLTDDLDDSIALFIGCDGIAPTAVDILDKHQQILRSHPL